MSNYTPKLSFTARDFVTMRAEMLAIIKSTRPDAYSDFSQSDLGVMLVEMAALVGDTISFGQDQIAGEMFLATCRRLDSALRFARSVGYTPRLATGAEVTVKSLSVPDALLLNGGTIPKGAKLTGQNGLTYELLEDLEIAAGVGTVRASLRQGTSIREEFAATAQQNQTITVSTGVVEDGSWVVYVGDPTISGNDWVQVDNVEFETSPSKTYDVSVDADGRPTFRFGSGNAGLVPTDTITVDYRTCDGAAGNAPVSSIKGALKVNLASPATGTVSVTFENRDEDSLVDDGTQLHEGESQGTTNNAATQTGTLENTPVQSGTLSLTFVLAGGAGTIVLQDTGLGVFTVVSNSTALTLSSSAVTYSTGAWTATFSAVLAAGGTIAATYFAIVAGGVDGATIVGAASGGADRESLVELKVNIPAYIRSQDRVMTVDDYNTVLRRLPGIALSLVDRYVASYSANMVKVNVWGKETVSVATESYDGSSAVVEYDRYAQVQDDRINEIQAFLSTRTVLSIHNIILRPAMLWVDVYLGPVTYDKRLAVADVRLAIAEAIVSVFESGTGFVIRLADIYDAVRATNGVRYFTIQRLATGTQATSAEVQGQTTTSPTVAGTLLDPVATPGSVVVTIEQPTANVILQDNGAGGWTVTGGTLAVASGSIDYVTGGWTATMSANLVPNQRVLASYANVTEDLRHDQLVTLDTTTDNDAWPPPPVAITSPVTTPPFKDGVPLSATRLGATQSPPYLGGDVLTYAKLRDITISAAVTETHYYDETYQYNNEILYDSLESITSDVRAINLRRLVFDLIPE